MDSIEWGKDGLQHTPRATHPPAAVVAGGTYGSVAHHADAYPVLIVDDDEAIRDTLATLLEDAGYVTLAAGSGREALAMLRTAATPEVVLLDLIMPEPDGQGVLRAVAADQHLARRHAFIIVTAAADALLRRAQAEVRGFDAGLTLDTVRKPFDIDDVVATVERVEQRLHAALNA